MKKLELRNKLVTKFEIIIQKNNLNKLKIAEKIDNMDLCISFNLMTAFSGWQNIRFISIKVALRRILKYFIF